MSTVKTVIEGIVKPLIHICNFSFQSGTVPDKMKMAKVISLFKTGDRHHFTKYFCFFTPPILQNTRKTVFR